MDELCGKGKAAFSVQLSETAVLSVTFIEYFKMIGFILYVTCKGVRICGEDRIALKLFFIISSLKECKPAKNVFRSLLSNERHFLCVLCIFQWNPQIALIIVCPSLYILYILYKTVPIVKSLNNLFRIIKS